MQSSIVLRFPFHFDWRLVRQHGVFLRTTDRLSIFERCRQTIRPNPSVMNLSHAILQTSFVAEARLADLEEAE